MKVCTDACLFAAWAVEKLKNEKVKIENILDIGTGTGLLSLMLAQLINAQIDAVEIDEQAAQQAKENFKSSPWSNLLKIYNVPIQNFISTTYYDLVISNPPFFQQSLKSNNNERNLAKHGGSLSYNELTNIVLKLKSSTGKFCLLLPYFAFSKFELKAREKRLHLVYKADVQQTPSHSFFRTMGIFAAQPSTEKCEIVCIKDDENNYTPRFIQLLKDYYLYL